MTLMTYYSNNKTQQLPKKLERESTKGVPGGPSGPSREGPGVGQKIVSDTKQMTKEKKKENMFGQLIDLFDLFFST